MTQHTLYLLTHTDAVAVNLALTLPCSGDSLVLMGSATGIQNAISGQRPDIRLYCYEEHSLKRGFKKDNGINSDEFVRISAECLKTVTL